MCGIAGAVSQQNVAPVLLYALKQLEYRGYDSAGIVVNDSHKKFKRKRVLGKVHVLQTTIEKEKLQGTIGIAHTRWATHGKPSKRNAHPHIANNEIALVHNGIIENNETLRNFLIEQGCHFSSDTDSELIAHLVYLNIQSGHDLLSAVKLAGAKLEGSYAIALMRRSEPDHLIVLKHSSPLVVGIGKTGCYVASDLLALLTVTNKFIYLEQDDIADIYHDHARFYDKTGNEVQRTIHTHEQSEANISKGSYAHYMLKEIHEQPNAVLNTMQDRIGFDHVKIEAFGKKAKRILTQTKCIQIAACGTSYHAGLVAKYWLEEIAGIPCEVEIASENRYRRKIIAKKCLFIAISQSGETADTLAALQQAKQSGYFATLAICNVMESSITREADLVLITSAGPEIAVASTKAFTTQLTALMLLTIALEQTQVLNNKVQKKLIKELRKIPTKLYETLLLDSHISQVAKILEHRHNVLFVARNIELPIAMEGALKMKEISYIHAEAYPSGELKHGTIALIDDTMTVIVLAATDELLPKIKSNVDEILARNGRVIIYTDQDSQFKNNDNVTTVVLPTTHRYFAPFVYAVAMQLFAYHVALLKKSDIDQPRNLAKSVTVE